MDIALAEASEHKVKIKELMEEKVITETRVGHLEKEMDDLEEALARKEGELLSQTKAFLKEVEASHKVTTEQRVLVNEQKEIVKEKEELLAQKDETIAAMDAHIKASLAHIAKLTAGVDTGVSSSPPTPPLVPSDSPVVQGRGRAESRAEEMFHNYFEESPAKVFTESPTTAPEEPERQPAGVFTLDDD